MKKLNLLLLFAGFLFAAGASAQHAVREDEQKDNQVIPQADPSNDNTVYTKYRRNNEVVQTTGKTYTATELQRMPNRDINAIANTVSGVQSRGGETPSIRGADPSGTAYYMDGVRIYGRIR